MAIVTVGGIREREGVLEPPSAGHWSHAFLTEATFGPRFGEAVALGPGTSVGKSTLLIQEMASDLGAGNPVGDFLLEEPPAETTASGSASLVDSPQLSIQSSPSGNTPQGLWEGSIQSQFVVISIRSAFAIWVP